MTAADAFVIGGVALGLTCGMFIGVWAIAARPRFWIVAGGFFLQAVGWGLLARFLP